MLTKKMVALTVAATAGLAVAACSDSGDTAPETAPETVTETVAPETVTETSNAGAAVSEDLPVAVTGYSDEARKDLVDENVTEAEVQDVLKAAQDGKAKVEWDDDGYFEVEFGEIDIDIDKDGLVLDVDR